MPHRRAVMLVALLVVAFPRFAAAQATAPELHGTSTIAPLSQEKTTPLALDAATSALLHAADHAGFSARPVSRSSALAVGSVLLELEQNSGQSEDSGVRLRRTPNPLRAALENLLFLLGGTLWYVIDDRNVLDWDLESWDQRFSEEAYRFDNNGFSMNFLAHPLSGAAFYGVPRANGLSMPVSALYGIASSFIWEFFIEFKERFSINDAISTPIGGFAIGEAFYRVARFFSEEMHPALAWTLGLPVAVHDAMDGRPVGRESPRARRSPGQELRFGYGFGWAFGEAFDFDLHTLSAAARFVELPGRGQLGARSGVFFDAEVTSMKMEGFVSTGGVGFQLFADTMLLGVHATTASEISDSWSRVLVGTSVSQLYRKERYEKWRDRLAFTGFPGLAVDVEEHTGAWGVRMSGRLQGGFGASHAPTFGPWWEQNPEDTKTILMRHGYYYGWGWLGSAELEVKVPWVTFGGALGYLALSSQEGLDRSQDLVVNDVHADDELLELAAWARLTGLPFGFFAEASYRAQLRRSALGDTELARELHRYQLALGMRL